MSSADDSDAMSPDEAALVAELRRALGTDPEPDGLVRRAEGLIAFMDFERELLELVDERPAELAGSRGGEATSARLVFESGPDSVSVEVVLGRDRLDGQVLAGEPNDVVLEHADGSEMSAAVDELGRFSLDRVGEGPVRLRLQGGEAVPVTTDWFLL